ncbi:unnamed protein product [Debaryomyces fabryi]|nr:unnamed protein product [Debaryomyces fabryi]
MQKTTVIVSFPHTNEITPNWRYERINVREDLHDNILVEMSSVGLCIRIFLRQFTGGWPDSLPRT